MSSWRRIALEKLPEYRDLIEHADNPMALWIDLHIKFKEVYRAETPDDGVIRRFYEYARWCLESPGARDYLSEAGSAAACAFYEHLPQNGVIRRDLPRWLSRDEFLGLRDVFRYHLSDEEYRIFEAEFLGKTKKWIQK